MLGDILHFHRTEGAKADMQGYMGDLYTGILYLLQKLFCKVQSCGRSGCASLVFRVYRLVAVLVLQFVCDIRRQRQMPPGFEKRADIARPVQPYPMPPEFPLGKDFHAQIIAKTDDPLSWHSWRA